MAEKVNVGDLLNGSMDQLKANKPSVLKYLAIFMVLGAISAYLDFSFGFVSDPYSDNWEVGFDYGPLGMGVLIASFVGQFWLFGKMLGVEVDFSSGNSSRIAAFFGLAFVTGLGVMFATILLVVPGVILGARWLMSPAFFVHDGERVFDALGKSWEATKGNTVPIALAALVIALLLGLLTGVLTYTVMLNSYAVDAIIGAVLSEIVTVIFIALSVTAFRSISSSSGQVAQVFD